MVSLEILPKESCLTHISTSMYANDLNKLTLFNCLVLNLIMFTLFYFFNIDANDVFIALIPTNFLMKIASSNIFWGKIFGN